MDGIKRISRIYDKITSQIGSFIITMATKLAKVLKKDKEPKQLKLSFNKFSWQKTKDNFCGELKKFALVGQLIKYTVTILLILIFLATVIPLLPVPGNYEPLVVMSGSMEPAIHIGSIAVIKPSSEYSAGDIITFPHPKDPNNLITHRIQEIAEDKEEGLMYVTTKGDANQTADSWKIALDDVKGKLLFSIPYLGYLVHFSKTPQGFALLIILPAILIILDELRIIKKEIEKKVERKYKQKFEEESKDENSEKKRLPKSIKKVKKAKSPPNRA